MSLDLSVYDDTALEALAPKGVVRRARRDFEAGLATVTEQGAKTAIVNADSETVKIDTRGPKDAQCTCPAPGICRHILLAVMALNADAPAAQAEAQGDSATATAEICALAQADIQNFAGADWPDAVALATSSPNSTIQDAGRNCTVEIDGSPASVTFLQGLGLKGAAFKGPKSRARTIIAAAALILRAKNGAELSITPEDSEDAPITGVSQEYLDDASTKLLQGVRMVLAGASPVAADTLFDLAISARAEVAPRLTSQLRALVKQSHHAAERMVHFEAENFLADAARTYALIEALKSNPTDIALTGVLRRNYQPAPATDLWMLGAVRWQTETGARGLTLHGFDPAAGQWRAVVQARAAGLDPTFDPRTAFTMPMWNAGAANNLIGKIVHLPEPLISDDGAIAPTLPKPAAPRDSIPRARALIENGAAISLWAQLRNDIVIRRGFGLHRRATPLAVLMAPTKFGALSFDEFTANYEFEALDQAGDAIRLVMPHSAYLDAKRLSEMSRSPLLLAETSGDIDRPALRPVSILHDGQRGFEVINLTLDVWTAPKPDSALDKLQDLLPRRASASRLSSDPLAELARRALAEATITAAGEPAPNIQTLQTRCDDAGLSALAASLRRLGAERNAAASLATAYLASEILASLSWA